MTFNVYPEYLRTENDDSTPLPLVNIDALLAEPRPSASDAQTISVEILSIVGTTASAVLRDPHVFYDTELLVIVHRSKSNGLVSTAVWSWRGKKNEHGEREGRKVHELARRYNTTLVRPLALL